MAERNIISMPSGNRVDLSGMEPGAQEFVKNVLTRADAKFINTEFGHAAMALAYAAIGENSLEKDHSVQIDYLKRCALEKIAKHGPTIIPLLRDELRLALTDDDLIQVGYK